MKIAKTPLKNMSKLIRINLKACRIKMCVLQTVVSNLIIIRIDD